MGDTTEGIGVSKKQPINEVYKDMLLKGYTKSPKSILSKEVYRVLHDVESDGYVFFMANFVEDIHLLVGKNIPALCDRIADEILRHVEITNEPTPVNNAPKR
jgi:hypothetical protein